MAGSAGHVSAPGDVIASFRIRTLTLGLPLPPGDPFTPGSGAIASLDRARRLFNEAGFEVQTLRLSTSLVNSLSAGDASLELVQQLDQLVRRDGVLISLGAARAAGDEAVQARWLAEVNGATSGTFFSVPIAAENRPDPAGVRLAAAVMRAVARPIDAGLGNFRFGAAANVPEDTPFFPVAWHGDGPATLAIGVEGAPIVHTACESTRLADVPARVSSALAAALAPVERTGRMVAGEMGWRFTGIDLSPAPLAERSIAAAVEAVTGRPFGSPSTLAACAAITEGVRSAPLPACGYTGLMLPVLEDAVLAARAVEGRLTLQQLLACSAVCGTGLDVVPLPGDTSVEDLAAILADVAALSSRLRKPLGARLLLAPGLRAGDRTPFDDPYLVNTTVLAIE